MTVEEVSLGDANCFPVLEWEVTLNRESRLERLKSIQSHSAFVTMQKKCSLNVMEASETTRRHSSTYLMTSVVVSDQLPKVQHHSSHAPSHYSSVLDPRTALPDASEQAARAIQRKIAR